MEEKTAPAAKADEGKSKDASLLKDKQNGDSVTVATDAAPDADPDDSYHSPQPSQAILEDEVEHMSNLGLGKAVDITRTQPWINGSVFQAKEVSYDEIVAIVEGQHVRDYEEVIDNYFDLQGNLESSVMIPNQPVTVGIAADMHRCKQSRKVVRGKSVSTRIIFFQVKPVSETTSTLEEKLQEWVISYGSAETKTKMRRDSLCSDNCSKACYEFIVRVGGITHYISSITLGATEFSTKGISKIATEAHSKVGLNTPAGIAFINQKLGFSRKVEKRVTQNELIGRIETDGKSEKVTIRTENEAVISFSITPLTNLISHQPLRDSLLKAIQQYMQERLHKKDGPFLIATAELGQKCLYWCVEHKKQPSGVGKYFIELTHKKTDAARFYIRPHKESNELKFFITTHTNTDGESGAMLDDSNIELYVHVITHRFLEHLPRSDPISLEAFSAVDPDKALFQVIDRVDQDTKPVMDAMWIPQESIDYNYQPCFIRPCSHFLYCLGIDVASEQFRVASRAQHNEGEYHMLFSLISA